MVNFLYDTEYASDYQLVPCHFDTSNSDAGENISQLAMEQSKVVGTDEFVIISNNYSSAFSYSFEVCKNPCNTDNIITPEEYSKINRWLNRKESHKFKIVQEGYEGIYFKGRFNISPIRINEQIYGISLTFISDYPYGFLDEITTTFSGTEFDIYNHSDEVGEIYPYTTIKCLEAGELVIQNSMDNEVLKIKNCTKNEVIYIDNKNKVITSTNASHNLFNDFNYNYIKLVNTYWEKVNHFSSNINIEMEIKYSPVRKVGI